MVVVEDHVVDVGHDDGLGQLVVAVGHVQVVFARRVVAQAEAVRRVNQHLIVVVQGIERVLQGGIQNLIVFCWAEVRLGNFTLNQYE